MKALFDEYGELILEVVGAGVIISMVIAAIYHGGFFQQFIEQITQGAC